jgi:hypothetical protein
LEGVPKEMQLAIALRSVSDPTAKDLVSAVSRTLNDYSQFKSTFTMFIETRSGRVKQSNVRKSIYQDKYNKQSGLTLSGLFLKYAVLVELINALMGHFTLHIQRSFASVHVTSRCDEFLATARISRRERQLPRVEPCA